MGWVYASVALAIIAFLNVLRIFYGYRKREKDRGDTGPDQGTRRYTGRSPTLHPLPSGTTYSTRKSTGLTVVKQDEPIKAWKAAWVHLSDDGKVTIFGTVYHVQYEVEAVAQCELGRRHSVPDPNCTCGFYAKKTRKDIQPYYEGIKYNNVGLYDRIPAILEVELYGKVIEADDGYRAEKLRVMKVYAKGYEDEITCCWRWIETTHGISRPQACNNLATVEITYGNGSVPLCDKHYKHSLIEQPDRTPREIPNAETDWEWI